MVSSSPSQMFHSVMASMSSPIALRVVTAMWGNSSWEFDFGQMGKGGKEVHDALGVSARDILMLDITGVIVVLAVGVDTEMSMLQRVCVSQMAACSRDKIVKLVHGVWWVVDEVC
jgi:hypothetical protein